MACVIFTPEAIDDLERLRAFFLPKSPTAAQRAGEAIVNGVERLGLFPHLGRPVDGLPDEFREWLIAFGNSGYVARYRIQDDTVVILAIRHQKDAGYSST